MVTWSLVPPVPGRVLPADGCPSFDAEDFWFAGFLKFDRLERMLLPMNRWVSMPPGPDRDLLREQIEAEAADDKEYAAAVRAFINAYLGWGI